MICRKNRASILPDASSIFTSLYDEYVGIVRANVSSAVDLSAQVRKEFESILAKETGKKIALDSKVDQSLLGGYILRVGDLQIDDSLKTKINNLRRELKHRP
jgi:F-type H+-transporting ATPase subunit delta